MTVHGILGKINARGGVFSCTLVLLGYCAYLHSMAFDKIQNFDGRLASGSLWNMGLVMFVDSHPWIPAVWFAILVGILALFTLMEQPGWTRWVTFGFLGWPWVVYSQICTLVSGKILWMSVH